MLAPEQAGEIQTRWLPPFVPVQVRACLAGVRAQVLEHQEEAGPGEDDERA